MKQSFGAILSLSFASLVLSQVVSVGVAKADFSCPSGYLCFRDWETHFQVGKVSGNNANWTVFGWNDRADDFQNNGNSRQVCVYVNPNYNAAVALLERGEYYQNGSFADRVSSNKWTASFEDCPTS